MVHQCLVDGRQLAASTAGSWYQEHSEHYPDMDQKDAQEHTDDASSQRNWVIKGSPLRGRGVFASKKIQRGSLIFENKPLVIGPRADCVNKPFCTVCHTVCDVCSKCDKCQLLLCSVQCESSSDHGVLCAFIATNWTPKPDRVQCVETLASALIYLRFLLLGKEQKCFLSLLQKERVSKNYEVEALRSIWTIPEEQLRFMALVNSIIKINSFRISCNPREKTVPLRGLYTLSSFLNHSCVPNTRNIFEKDSTMLVFATRDIDVGEEILTCYTGLLWSTPARRCQLYKTKKFWCKCTRCEDRTELATNLSALKCLDKECVGVLLPILPTEPGTDWSCDNCHFKVDATRINAIQSVLGSLLGTLDLDDQFRLETFVLERLAKFVPYSSHIFVDLRLRLALRIGFTGMKLNDGSACRCQLSESRLALKESLCRGTLRSVAALGAGDAHLRGLLLYHLHGALAERARRCPDLFDELKSEIESSIEQAYHILQGDISAPPDLELRRRYLGPGCDKPHQERFFILDN